MKYLLIAILLIKSVHGFSLCRSSGIWIWPHSQNISTNSIFVIEGYSSSQQVVYHLNTRNKIYLKSGDEIVPLDVVKTIVGGYDLTQAIVRPRHELTIGKTYTIFIDSLGKYDHFKLTSWMVREADKTNPIWNCVPKYHFKSVTYLGCGPAVNVHFCGGYEDASPVLVYTKVKNEDNGSASEYYITTNGTEIEIGHGMCGGAFDFEEKANYSVQFGLMDASGNKDEMLTEPIKFTSPYEKNASPKSIETCDCKNSYSNFIYISLGVLLFLILIPIVVQVSKNAKKHAQKGLRFHGI